MEQCHQVGSSSDLKKLHTNIEYMALTAHVARAVLLQPVPKRVPEQWISQGSYAICSHKGVTGIVKN